MTTEIQLNGVRYAIGKLSAMQQFHVSRRIASIIPPMIPVLMNFYAELEQADVARQQARANAALAALAEGGTPDEEADAPAADKSRELLSLVDAIAPVLQPFADALAGLKDEDAEYVFGTCLSVVERWQGAGWAKVWSAAHKTSMFDDIGIDVMLPLVVRVVVANLGPLSAGCLPAKRAARRRRRLDSHAAWRRGLAARAGARPDVPVRVADRRNARPGRRRADERFPRRPGRQRSGVPPQDGKRKWLIRSSSANSWSRWASRSTRRA